MALSTNSLSLIQHLESLAVLEGRYTNIKCVNVNTATGVRDGVLSLVFKAFDIIDQKLVALKFYDIDPVRYFDQYRQASFRREHTILQSILGVRRCLQVVSNFSTYMLQVPQPTGLSLTIPCPYFAVEWIDQDIDDFFEAQDTKEPLEKLRVFYDIVLAVEALHRHAVHHRDLKKDNLRAYHQDLERLVIAIDLGTAARTDSPQILNTYDNVQVLPHAFR